MVVSLTATPMMCAHLLKRQESHGWMFGPSERAFTWVVNAYGRTLTAGAESRRRHTSHFTGHHRIETSTCFIHVPQGIFPAAGQWPMMGSIQADQDTSFQAMDRIRASR